MLEYFSYKKFKKHREAREAGAQEVLTPIDETFFQQITDDPGAHEVPLPSSPGDLSGTVTPAGGSETSSAAKKATWKDSVAGYREIATGYAGDTYEKAKTLKIPDVPVPGFFKKKEKKDDVDHKDEKEEHHKEKKDKGKGKQKEDDEEYLSTLTDEERQLHEALDSLHLAAQDGKAFSLSAETRSILQKFTQILKDMVNGVPTAYDDLINLFETKHKQIESLFNNTPGFVKKLAKQLPLGLSGDKVTGEGAGLAAQAATLGIPTLKQLVTKPGAVANALKTAINVIKLRFPGVALGTNVVFSLALFVLLFVFWYCYKRGKETRLEKERQEWETEDSKLAEEVLAGAPSVPLTDPGESSSSSSAPVRQLLEAEQNTTTGVLGSGNTEFQHSTAPGGHSAI